MKVNLKKIIEQSGLEKSEIARLVGVSRQTIHAVETSKYCPSVLVALKLSKVLKVDITEIFELEKDDL
jgi:putative transcriptional regulator